MATEAREAPLAGDDLPAGRKRVLVVEDNPLNMKLFVAMITAQGYEVLEAFDGPRGLDLAHRQRPDLIVMDVQLPGMSGLDVTRSLKIDDSTRDIPIIATSAYFDSGDDARLRASGCDGFMAKPIAVLEFLDMVAAFMAEPGPARPLTRS